MSLGEAMAHGLGLALAGAAHCAGMCGVFAMRAAAARAGGAGLYRLIVYTIGKSFTYVFIGALAGAVGQAALSTASWVQAAVGILVGLALAMAAMRLLRATPFPAPGAGHMARYVGMLVGALPRGDRLSGSFFLGMVTGAIPCGLVYIAALESAALGSPLGGAVLMSAFGLGTVWRDVQRVAGSAWREAWHWARWLL